MLAAVVAGYLCLLAAIFAACMPPGSSLPEFLEFDRLVFSIQSPSRMERLLEAPGERIGAGGSMRPAFTADSVGWQEIAEQVTGHEMIQLLQEREGERQALLAWVRSGA